MEAPSSAAPASEPGGAEAPVGSDGDEPAPEAATRLRVNVLGQFTIAGHHVGDRNKPWKYTKTSELILYLLLHPDGASQDLLMEQLFPEQPTNRPRLNQLVSDARTKALGVDHNGEYHLPHASPSDPFYRLTTSIQKRLNAARASGRLRGFPPVLTFQSVVDATVSTQAVFSGLYQRLGNAGHELVLFDINRHAGIDSLLVRVVVSL
jgi:hypothetical protein